MQVLITLVFWTGSNRSLVYQAFGLVWDLQSVIRDVRSIGPLVNWASLNRAVAEQVQQRPSHKCHFYKLSNKIQHNYNIHRHAHPAGYHHKVAVSSYRHDASVLTHIALSSL